MARIGIAGYGIVGQAVEYSFRERNPKHEFRKYDKYKKGLDSLENVVKNSDFIFVCLPTPAGEKGIDLSIMDENIERIACYNPDRESVVVIKSTVVPMTTRKYGEKHKNVRFAFNPEFLTEANYLKDALNPDRIIVGADNNRTMLKVVDLYRIDFPNVPIHETDSVSAELVKYMANCFLATKVMFANEMYDICQALGIRYDEVKKMTASDKRIGESHLDVTTVRGFGGKCLPKDIRAMIGFAKEQGVDVPLLEMVWERNLRIRKIKDWEDIPGTTSDNQHKFGQ